MTCEQARASLSAVFDGEAAPGASARLEGHLRTCAACRAYERDLAAVHRLVRVTAAPTVPDLTAAILARTGSGPRTDRASGALRLALVAGIGLAWLLEVRVHGRRLRAAAAVA